MSGIGEPTRWLYEGYCPDLPDDLEVIIFDTGRHVMGKDMWEWELKEAPEKFFVDDDYMNEPLPPFPFTEEDLEELHVRNRIIF
ncbi:MAG: hypothetical protein NC548_29420 [Lachnospiraceae bacterium]|nr:hypothetical protein [Lachnospiraceae bacterium]